MGYLEERNKQYEKYEKMWKAWDEVINKTDYFNICSQMPFEFLRAKQSAETLTLVKEMGEDSKLKFSRVDEAISLYSKIVNTMKDKDTLLDNASLIVKADDLAKEINAFVDSTPYLSDNLKVSEGGSVVSIANQVIKMLPDYPELMTRSFLRIYIESCIDSFSKEGLALVAKAKCITKNGLTDIRKDGTPEFKQKLEYLKEILGVPAVIHYPKITVVGVTYSNDDGVSRQELLRAMKEADNLKITLNPTVFEKDGVSKPAIEVLWGNSLVGYLGQELASNLTSNYSNASYEVQDAFVRGGTDGLSFGLSIDFDVIVPREATCEVKEAERE